MLGIKLIRKNEYLYSVVSKIITIFISLLQSIVVARYLGAELKGSSAYISSIVSIVNIIITFGIHQAYPYFKKNEGKEQIYRPFLTIVYLLFGFYFVASIIASFFITDIELKYAILLVPIYGYGRVVAYVALVENPNKRNFWWVISSIIDVIFIVFLYIFVERSVEIVFAILIFAELLKAIIYTVLLKAAPLFSKNLFSVFFKLIQMGFLPMIALLLTTLNYKVDVLMLEWMGVSSSLIGIYSIGMNFADKIVLIPDTLKGVLMSRLSKGANEEEVAKVCRISFWSSFVICIIALLLGDFAINLLYGNEYDGAYSVLLICSFGSLFVGYFKLIAQYNIINKKQIRNVLLLMGSIVVNVILNYLLIPSFGLNGAAFASGVGYFLTGVVFVSWFAYQNKIRIWKMFIPQKNDLNAIKKLLKNGGKK